MTVKRRRQVISAITGFFAVCSFLAIFGFAIVWANGLSIDLGSRRIEQTAVLAIEGRQQDANVFLNNTLVGTSIPLQLRNLKPGLVTIKLEKQHFHSFDKTVQLIQGRATVIEDVSLCAVSPLIKVLPLDQGPKYYPTPPFDRSINVIGGEVYDNGQLVTRMSGSPLSFMRFRGGYLYQFADELHYFKPSRNTDFIIYRLPSQDLAKVTFDERNVQIYLHFQDVVTRISILESSESEATPR